jgi:hypothetical protein
MVVGMESCTGFVLCNQHCLLIWFYLRGVFIEWGLQCRKARLGTWVCTDLRRRGKP